MSQVRDGDKRVVRVKEGNCQGKHVVIGNVERLFSTQRFFASFPFAV